MVSASLPRISPGFSGTDLRHGKMDMDSVCTVGRWPPRKWVDLWLHRAKAWEKVRLLFLNCRWCKIKRQEPHQKTRRRQFRGRSEDRARVGNLLGQAGDTISVANPWIEPKQREKGSTFMERL